MLRTSLITLILDSALKDRSLISTCAKGWGEVKKVGRVRLDYKGQVTALHSGRLKEGGGGRGLGEKLQWSEKRSADGRQSRRAEAAAAAAEVIEAASAAAMAAALSAATQWMPNI